MDGSGQKVLVDGWVVEAKSQIEHMYPPKYQVPPGIPLLLIKLCGTVLLNCLYKQRVYKSLP